MTTWIFVRHGESTANRDGVLAGQEDVPLTQLGREQAQAVGQQLAGKELSRVVCSDLQRARHTAELAVESYCAQSGVAAPAIEILPALRERDGGSLVGQSRPALREDGRMKALLSWTGRPPGGESLAELARRAVAGLAGLGETQGDVILVVGHGGVFRCLLGLVDGMDLEAIGRVRVPNAQALVRFGVPGLWSDLLSRLTHEVRS